MPNFWQALFPGYFLGARLIFNLATRRNKEIPLDRGSPSGSFGYQDEYGRLTMCICLHLVNLVLAKLKHTICRLWEIKSVEKNHIVNFPVVNPFSDDYTISVTSSCVCNQGNVWSSVSTITTIVIMNRVCIQQCNQETSISSKWSTFVTKIRIQNILVILQLYWNPITLVFIRMVLRQAFRW
jgi:hypothetical protein